MPHSLTTSAANIAPTPVVRDGKAAHKGGRAIALALGGARGRSMLRIVGETGIATTHDDQRDHDGHNQQRYRR